MKVKIYSDLHLEFASFNPGQSDADVVILAGDIHTKARGVDWANDAFSCPVLYVCGNHEFYRGHLELTLIKMKGSARSHVHVLNNEAFVSNQTRFLCATAWTDFALTGDVHAAKKTAWECMNDYAVIRTADNFRRLRPDDLVRESRATYAWLYAIGYKEAADGLLQAIADRKVSLDSGIYLLVFLYRHALELQLKLILPLARRVAGESPTDDHRHELMPMWRVLRRLLTEIAPEAEDKDLLAMESFIQQLSDVDPSSFAFRYSTGKKGDVSLPGLQHINIRHLSEILDSVFMMFDGIYSWLGEKETNNPYY